MCILFHNTDRVDNATPYQLVLDVLMTLRQELFCSLQDAILSSNFCYFQALLFVKGVFASKLINITLKLRQKIKKEL